MNRPQQPRRRLPWWYSSCTNYVVALVVISALGSSGSVGVKNSFLNNGSIVTLAYSPLVSSSSSSSRGFPLNRIGFPTTSGSTISNIKPPSSFFVARAARTWSVVSSPPGVVLYAGGAAAPGAPASSSSTSTNSLIISELQNASMKLHTREQAPREGKAPSAGKKTERYVPTRSDYLAFLVDSQFVFQAMEDFVNKRVELKSLQNTGLERTIPLEKDIGHVTKQYGLDRPSVGPPGREYADQINNMQSIPEFICHYYNFYFAHTAGGRMIGKQMSTMLLDGQTLEFYKWEGDLNTMKTTVKESIEDIASNWCSEDRQCCVNATISAFAQGTSIVSHITGESTTH